MDVVGRPFARAGRVVDGNDPCQPAASYDRSDDLRANSVLRDQLGRRRDSGLEEVRLDEQTLLALGREPRDLFPVR